MAIKIQLRRGTAAEWTSANPVLMEGEMGVETDTLKVKLGNGTTAWTSLSYFTQGAAGPANALAIGSVLSGTSASATITGTAPSQTLNLVLPKGDTGSTGATGATGATGPANSLSIGTVASGASAAATITGTAPSQTLNLTLPKGDTGATGATGATGPAGADGVGIPAGGATGQVLAKSSATNYATAWVTAYQSPNFLINGAFEINQRGYASGASLASGAYGFDRWKSGASGTTLTFTSAPQGQLVTLSSGGVIQQVIERQSLLAGTYTLSWQGTATARVYNFGSTAPAYASSPVTVSLDGSANVVVEVTATGGSKTFGFAQLELGATATAFRRSANNIQGELAACQRYYFRFTQDVNYKIIGQASTWGADETIFTMALPVSMRVTPTLIALSGGNTWYFLGNGTNYSGATNVVTWGTKETVSFNFQGMGVPTNVSTQVRPAVNNYFEVGAEL